MGFNALIAETHKPYYSANLDQDPHQAYPPESLEGIHSTMGVPLIAQQKLIGFFWCGATNTMAEADMRLLLAIGDIAANAIYRATLHERTQKSAADLAIAYESTLEGWAYALELRDQETEGHARRVVERTVRLAQILGVTEDDLVDIRRGALLHDIGKMGVPDSILLKPGTLNDREWETMRRHPDFAKAMLKRIDFLNSAMDIP
jgi:HD-GYP domain-containing protein (c-di-GMP phosphodiesterase class II)